MSYSVNFHPLAEEDYDHIFAYIAERSQDGALSWDNALDGAIDSLKYNPDIYSRIPEAVISQREYKQILFKTRYGNKYRAVFAIEGNLVIVLRIRGQGQPPLLSKDLP